MEWQEVLAIVVSMAGLLWMQTSSLNKRIDDLKSESAKAHADIGSRIEKLTDRFDRHLHWHADK